MDLAFAPVSPTGSKSLAIPSAAYPDMPWPWNGPIQAKETLKKRRGDTSGQKRCRGSGRKLYASFISVYSSCLPCRRQEEQEEGRETERLESYTPSNEDLKRENDEDMPVDTAVSQGQAVGKG